MEKKSIGESMPLTGPMDKLLQTEEQRQKPYLMSTVKYIVKRGLPIGECVDPSYRAHIRDFNKNVKPFSRQTVQKQILIFAAECRKKIVNLLKNEYVALTFDCWTSDGDQSFGGMTCHWINNEWQLKSVTLDCSYFPGCHNSTIVAEKIGAIAHKNGIEDWQVIALVTDNEPTMNAMANEIPYSWMGCFDHILQMIAVIAYDHSSIAPVMKKVRSLVGYFSLSTQASSAIKADQQNDGKNPKTLIQDVKTRWWSTYEMCSRLFDLKVYVQSHLIRKSLSGDLTVEEWNLVESTCNILKPFRTIQIRIEAEASVTVSLIPYLVSIMREKLEENLDKYAEDDILQPFA
jgi:hypothetical protein